MRKQLILHEGLKLKPYQDTVGKWTIGVGYNLTDRGHQELETIIGHSFDRTQGLTREEALRVLDHDIDTHEAGVIRSFPHYLKLDEVRQRVCVDMAFNMGHRALSFTRTMACIVRGEYVQAAENMLQSRWANQVGDGPGSRFDRAERLAEMMRTGKDYST